MAVAPSSAYVQPWRGLPGDIRNYIWSLAATYDEIYIPTIHSTICRCNRGRDVRSRLPSRSVLLACKESNRVSTDRLYQNPFHISGGFVSILGFLRSVDPCKRRLIKDIRITWEDNHHHAPGSWPAIAELHEMLTRNMHLTVLSVDYSYQHTEEHLVRRLFDSLINSVIKGELGQVRLCFLSICDELIPRDAGPFMVMSLLKAHGEAYPLVENVFQEYNKISKIDIIPGREEAWLLAAGNHDNIPDINLYGNTGWFDHIYRTECSKDVFEDQAFLHPYTISISDCRRREKDTMAISVIHDGQALAWERLLEFEKSVIQEDRITRDGLAERLERIDKAKVALEQYGTYLRDNSSGGHSKSCT